MSIRRTAPLAFLLLAACASNYDFSKAKLPTGEWDLAKLTADLNASGETELRDFSWIPLIRMRLTSFGPAESSYPTGFRLRDMTAGGPLFFGMDVDQRYVDGKGEMVESQAVTYVGWGLLYNQRNEQIATQFGIRTTKGWHTLLFFGKDSFEYVGPEGKAKAQ